jgi:TRAP-type C4-dicarboxylate transport system substrate-binding protein
MNRRGSSAALTSAVVLVCAGALLSDGKAHADPTVTLRLATVAPEGTAWARELKAFARDVATQTNEGLQVKWYLGGIAGDDVVASERIRKDQLDGLGSGGMLCERISPTMRAMHMLTENREEAFYVTNRLHKQIEDEFRRNGYVYLGAAGLGPDVLFTREPVRTLEDLKKVRLWVWDLDDVATVLYPAIGVKTVPLGVNDGYRAYEENRTDGFVALPAAALAFQWSAQTRYVSDLRMGFVTGCVVIAQRAFDQIPADQREAFKAAGAKMQNRFEDLGRVQDEQLLHGGMFAKQGLRPVPVSTDLKSSYEKAALSARSQLGKKLVGGPQLEQVQQLLEEFRAQKK